MKWKIILIFVLILMSLWNVPIIPVEALPPEAYDITKYDPKEDVMQLRTGGTCLFAEWANVEIAKMTSTFIDNTVGEDQIEMTMTVMGTVQNNEDYKYVFLVKA